MEKDAEKECHQTLGVAAHSTRGRGTALKWSKSLNADKPIVYCVRLFLVLQLYYACPCYPLTFQVRTR